MPGERWKNIAGFENTYQASTFWMSRPADTQSRANTEVDSIIAEGIEELTATVKFHLLG